MPGLFKTAPNELFRHEQEACHLQLMFEKAHQLYCLHNVLEIIFT